MTMQALVYSAPSPSSPSPISIHTLPIPTPTPGSAILKILSTTLSPNARSVYHGTFLSAPPSPFTLSAPAIGRIHALGADASTLRPAQLVFFDFSLRARDSPGINLLQGYISVPGGPNDILARAWPHGTLAQFACVPLENVFPLNEAKLSRDLGYTPADLTHLADAAIATEALLLAGVDGRQGGVGPGSTVIVAPSTGRFSGNVVQVALALGARVVACGRTEAKLAKVRARYAKTYPSGRLATVVLSENGNNREDVRALRNALGTDPEDGVGGADVFVDVSPTTAGVVSHIAACMQAVRYQGRTVFMGGIEAGIGVPYFAVMWKELRVSGSRMFGREAFERTVRLVEDGHLRLGNKREGANGEETGFKVRRFGLEQLKEAFKANEDDPGFGNMVVVEPWAGSED